MSFSFISKNVATFAMTAKNFILRFLGTEDEHYLGTEDGKKIQIDGSEYGYQTKNLS